MQGTQTQPVPLAMPPQSPPKLRGLWQRAHILWFGSPSLGRRTNACQPIRHFQDLSMIKSAPPGRDRPDAQAWATSGTLASWRPSEPLPARDTRASWTHGQRSRAERRRGLGAHARTLLLFDAGRTTGARRKRPAGRRVGAVSLWCRARPCSRAAAFWVASRQSRPSRSPSAVLAPVLASRGRLTPCRSYGFRLNLPEVRSSCVHVAARPPAHAPNHRKVKAHRTLLKLIRKIPHAVQQGRPGARHGYTSATWRGLVHEEGGGEGTGHGGRGGVRP